MVGYTIDTLRQMIIEIIVDAVDVIYRATHKRSREEKLQDARERHKHVRLAKQSVIAFAIVVLWIGGAALFYFTERDHGYSRTFFLRCLTIENCSDGATLMPCGFVSRRSRQLATVISIHRREQANSCSRTTPL